MDYVEEIESIECNLNCELHKNISWELFRGRILYGTVVYLYARRYNRAAKKVALQMATPIYCMSLYNRYGGDADAYDTIERMVTTENFEIPIEYILLALANPIGFPANYVTPRMEDEGMPELFAEKVRDVLNFELGLPSEWLYDEESFVTDVFSEEQIKKNRVERYPRLRMRWWDMLEEAERKTENEE